MKQSIIALSVLGLLSAGCAKEKTANTEVSTVSTKDSSVVEPLVALRIDSLRVADSAVISKTLTLEYGQQLLVLSGLEKPLLDSLYKNQLSEDQILSDYSPASVKRAATARMQKYFSDSKDNYRDFMPERPQKWDQHSAMKVFSNNNKYLIIQYTGYGYTGGAHGYAYENYRVADLDKQKEITLEDLMEVKSVHWNRLLLEAAGDRKDELFDPNTLSYTQNFYFDDRAFTFVYGQYEIGPYAAGIIKLSVPFAKLSDALRPEFKNRMSIK